MLKQARVSLANQQGRSSVNSFGVETANQLPVAVVHAFRSLEGADADSYALLSPPLRRKQVDVGKDPRMRQPSSTFSFY